MDIPIQHQAFAGRGLAVRPAGLVTGARLLVDGQELRGKGSRFSVRDNAGAQREIRLKSNGIDPIPKVLIGSETIALARPLAWYEYLWMGIPVVLVFAGGALGALFGVLGIYASARIFRGDRGTVAKYGLSALISLGVALAFFLCAAALQIFLGRPATTA